MAIEIERKFLVRDLSWRRADIKGVAIKQGYLQNSTDRSVRVRIFGEKGFITVKGRITAATEKRSGELERGCNQSHDRCSTLSQEGVPQKKSTLSRLEFEYEIPVNDALEMLSLCEKPLVEKVRYHLDFMGFEWIIDQFEGRNEGLVVAEIELATEDQKFQTPPWAGVEVTDDPRYLNSNLIKNPFQNW